MYICKVGISVEIRTILSKLRITVLNVSLSIKGLIY